MISAYVERKVLGKIKNSLVRACDGASDNLYVIVRHKPKHKQQTIFFCVRIDIMCAIE